MSARAEKGDRSVDARGRRARDRAGEGEGAVDGKDAEGGSQGAVSGEEQGEAYKRKPSGGAEVEVEEVEVFVKARWKVAVVERGGRRRGGRAVG